MRPRLTSALIPCALVLGLVGCSDAGGEGGAPDAAIDAALGDGPAIGDLRGALAAAICAQAVRCQSYGSLEDCLGDQHPDLRQLVHAVEAGRITYQPDQAAACLAAVRDAACDATLADARVEVDACRATFLGTLADGAACFEDEACRSGDCATPTCSLACCPGTCGPTLPTPSLGQACPQGRCARGAYCSPAGTCEALVTAGGACSDRRACDYGLTCSTDRVCTDAPNRGASCAQSACADVGDRCDPDSKTCVPLQGRGGPCARDATGQYDCQRPLYCSSASLLCEELPPVGAACFLYCAPGVRCNDDFVCEAKADNGQPCANKGECASDFCDATSGVCADQPFCG